MTRQDWYAALAADPADLTRRLVFADWLDEHHEYDRAELVRAHAEWVAEPTERTRKRLARVRATTTWHTEEEIAAIRATGIGQLGRFIAPELCSMRPEQRSVISPTYPHRTAILHAPGHDLVITDSVAVITGTDYRCSIHRNGQSLFVARDLMNTSTTYPDTVSPSLIEAGLNGLAYVINNF